MHNCYAYDPAHLAAYDAAARSDEGFACYRDRYVHEPADHDGYLRAIGGEARLEELLQTPPPTADEVEILRHAVDPEGIFLRNGSPTW